MEVKENKIIINDYENEDYEIINQFLIKQNSINILEINNSIVNLDTIDKFINNTNISCIILNNNEIYYTNNELINVTQLVFNNVSCFNFEVFAKFKNIEKLIIKDLGVEFNCYYLRVLKKLKELNLINMKLSHINALGYLDKLNSLLLHQVPIKSWNFITKLYNLTDIYLSKEYSLEDIYKLYNVKIYQEDKE